MHLSYNTRDIDRPPPPKKKKNTRGQLIILWNPDGAIHHTHIRTSFDSRNEAFKSNCLLSPLRLQSQSQSTGGQFMGGWHRCRATETRTQLPLSSPLISLVQNQRMRLPLGTIGGWCFRKGLTSHFNPFQTKPNKTANLLLLAPLDVLWRGICMLKCGNQLHFANIFTGQVRIGQVAGISLDFGPWKVTHKAVRLFYCSHPVDFGGVAASGWCSTGRLVHWRHCDVWWRLFAQLFSAHFRCIWRQTENSTKVTHQCCQLTITKRRINQPRETRGKHFQLNNI